MSSESITPAPTAIESTQVVEADSIPLPAGPRRRSVKEQGRGLRGDIWIIPLVLALAFLAVSFPARNSDLWLHLASGRLLSERKAVFGADPFAYTTSQVYWANHSWLFDLGIYRLYNLMDGPGLVILKAALATILAMLLLSIRRPGSSFYLPIVCTTLAIVAAARYTLVQPVFVSSFLLGLTLWLLWKQPSDSEQSSSRPLSASHILLLVVCALWANVDDWFLLGPLMIALFWLGGRIEGKSVVPAWLIPAAFAACLLNPHTYHVFMLPADISPVTWTSGLRSDVRYQGLFASPWPEWLRGVKELHVGDSSAYVVLMVLGALSFLLNPQALRSRRLVLWLPFAILAALQARLIPFFVVAAAPVTALNLQDFMAARAEADARIQGVKGTKREIRFLLLALSPCFLAVCLPALAALAWLGALSGYAREERHVAWSVQPDPSLEQTAEVLRMWRSEGLLKDGERVFALAPEMGSYAAWFDPGETQFLDQRFSLFGPVAADFEAVCLALQPDLDSSGSALSRKKREHGRDWRQVFKDYGVAVAVYHDRDQRRLLRVLNRVLADSATWTLLNISGQALIVGWNEARPGGFGSLAWSPDQIAFGPYDRRVQREAPAAPEQGPEHLPPAARDITDRLIGPPPPPTWESAAGIVYAGYHDLTKEVQREQQRRHSWTLFGAGLAGLPALPTAVPQAAGQLYSARNLPFRNDPGEKTKVLMPDELGPFMESMGERSPALPLLVIRMTRRALAANPKDADAWFRLGMAYLMLLDETKGRLTEKVLPLLVEIRHVQIVTALEQALRLNPDLEEAHSQLHFLYGRRNYFDKALEHRQEEVRLARRADRRPDESAEEFADRMEFLDKDTAKLAEFVKEGQAKYAAASPALQGERLTQTDMALKLGLGSQALEGILLQTPADVLGPAGIKLELEMLLWMGRVEDVRSLLSDRGLRAIKYRLPPAVLAAPKGRGGRSLYLLPYRWAAYEWLHVLQSAAVGDYAQAREDLRAIRAELTTARREMDEQLRRFDDRVWRFIPGFMAGHAPFVQTLTALDLQRTLAEKQVIELSASTLRAQQADLCTIEGLLALEQGSTEAASLLFAEADRLGSETAENPVRSVSAPMAAYYLSKTKGGK
jgi:hypothetical protein